MAKLGDVKTCRMCGEVNGAELKRKAASNAGFSAPGGATSRASGEHVGWECRECGDVEPYNGQLET